MQYLQTTSGVIHFKEHECVAARRTVVFINSLGSDFRIWDEVVAGLADRFNVVLHDKAGHGLSSQRAGASTIAAYANDLEALLMNLNLSQVILCGISVGGLIAQSLYHKRPDLVRGMILSNTGLKIGTAESWAARIAAIKTGGISSISETILERWFAPEFRTSKPTEFALYKNMLERTPQIGYLACCEAIRDADFTSQAAKISVPVLCIAGEHDGSTPPALVQNMAAQISNARYEIISGAAHLPCIECPELYTKLISNFIESILASST
jgi:3-oxoadipate enol-lactonase